MNSQPIDHQEHTKSTTTTTSMHWKERSGHSSNRSSRISRVLRAVISMEICSQPQCWGTCLFLVLVFTGMTILLSVSLARAKPVTRIEVNNWKIDFLLLLLLLLLLLPRTSFPASLV
jgi:hypothetical protein